MDLNNVTVEMRPRSEWEAVDFGVRLIRRDSAALYRIWFAMTLPMVLLTAAAVLYSPYPMLAVFLYWWFEPITDGPILRVISRRLFGEDANVGSALRALPYLIRRNLIFLLPPYRFHLSRATALPVTQLEGLSGASRRARAKVLNMKIGNHGVGVTVAYQHLVLALYFGVYLIGYAMVPAEYQQTTGENWLFLMFEEESRTAQLISLALFYVAQSALHPWFVGAGFGLYINCRTQLEAWDIEVAFRRMVQRRAAAISAAVGAVIIASLMALPTVFVVQTAEADDETSSSSTSQDPGFSGFWSEDDVRAALDAAMQDEALATEQEKEVWRSIDPAEEAEQGDGAPDWLGNALVGFGKFISVVLEFGLWLFVAFLVVLIAVTSKHWLPYVGFTGSRRSRSERIILSSGELKAESLPSDIPAGVARLWRAGKKRDALSLLYRGSVYAAVVQHGVRLPPSATEGLCLAAVQTQTIQSRADFFESIVRVWSNCAYGFRNPDEAIVKSICAQWQQHFGEAT